MKLTLLIILVFGIGCGDIERTYYNYEVKATYHSGGVDTFFIQHSQTSPQLFLGRYGTGELAVGFKTYAIGVRSIKILSTVVDTIIHVPQIGGN